MCLIVFADIRIFIRNQTIAICTIIRFLVSKLHECNVERSEKFVNELSQGFDCTL